MKVMMTFDLCRLLGIWDVGNVGCWEYEMLGLWNVTDV